MPRYAPLPSVSIDPRSEAQIVQQASQRVYEASNRTLNDFSAGNPLAVLLEGQAFAQGEFLFWANQLPDKILIEWIGPFLGAMRRLGTASVARALISITPTDVPVTIPAGTRVSTDSNLTGGESFSFLIDTDIIIPAGETTTFGSLTSEFVGSAYNVPALSINSPGSINIDGLTIVNPQPAVGGSDVETFDQVKERFFTLIRRRNPVSEQDWQDFFVDFYGVGTVTSVQPNRPSSGSYNYLRDYKNANGQISFFVLGPDGVELTAEQLARGQNVVNFSVPVELTGNLYPMTLSQAQYNLSLEVSATGQYSGNFKEASLNFRNSAYDILTPGNVFPVDSPPTVGDIDAAFYSTIPQASRYTNPNIVASSVYNTPVFLDSSSATYTRIRNFEISENLLSLNDLVETTLPVSTFYPVIEGFTPYSSAKKDQTIYGNLELRQIKLLTPGVFSQGDVVLYDDGTGLNLRVILDNVTIGSSLEIPGLIAQGKISAVKTFTPWVEGNSYQNTSGDLLDPQLVAYDYNADEFIPEGTGPANKRPGSFVWYVAKNFTLGNATNDLTGALASAKLGSAITVETLLPGNSYTAGQWIRTEQVGSGPNQEVDPYYYYVDTTKGAVTKYAYVETPFTYDQGNLTVSEYFNELVLEGILKNVSVLNGDNGLPIYKYKARFPVCQYLEYRANIGAEPSYYMAAKYFTPDSPDISDLISQQLVFPLAPSDYNKTKLEREIINGSVKKPIKMFTFFRGEQTFFREGSDVKAYTATQNVSPLFEFFVYLKNEIFVPTGSVTALDFLTHSQYVPFFNPEYSKYAEDVVLAEDGKNYYRVMTAFTPEATTISWTNTESVNTARQEEYRGNLLRIVRKYDCTEEVQAQLGSDISAIKLGVAQITLIPKNSSNTLNPKQHFTYVWENTDSPSSTPELSWYTGTEYPYSPPNYREGTFSL